MLYKLLHVSRELYTAHFLRHAAFCANTVQTLLAWLFVYLKYSYSSIIFVGIVFAVSVMLRFAFG